MIGTSGKNLEPNTPLGRPQWSGELGRQFGGERGGQQARVRASGIGDCARASDEYCAVTVYRLK